MCVFLGHSLDHKDYQCLDLDINHVIISLHVVFSETTFPFSLLRSSPLANELDFLTNDDPLPVTFPPAGTSDVATLPVPVPSSVSLTSRMPPPGFPAPGTGSPTPSAPPPSVPAQELASWSSPLGFPLLALRSSTPALVPASTTLLVQAPPEHLVLPLATSPVQAPPALSVLSFAAPSAQTPTTPPVPALPAPRVQAPLAPLFPKPLIVHVYTRGPPTPKSPIGAPLDDPASSPLRRAMSRTTLMAWQLA